MLLDLSIYRGVLRIDLLNDFVGAIMILLGIRVIRGMVLLNDEYKLAMDIAFYAAIIQVILSIETFFTIRLTGWVSVVTSFLDLFAFVGIVMFCKGMKIFSGVNGMELSRDRWAITEKLFFWSYLILYGGCSMIYSIIVVVRTSEPLIISRWVGLILPFGIIATLCATVYGLYTIFKMKKELNERYQSW